jgi:hypothetical protein
MTVEEVKKLKEGDTLFWAVGKKYYKGKFLSLDEDVLDLKTLQVEDENGEKDEILHAFVVSEDKYLTETNKTFKPSFVKNKIEKSEELDDEEEIASDKIIENMELEVEVEKVETTKKVAKPIITTTTSVNPVNVPLNTVSSPRGNNSELKPNLKSLQILLQKEGYFIERNENRWIEYFLYLPDGQKVSFLCKLKVWQVYNIYIEKGIQGLLDLVS